MRQPQVCCLLSGGHVVETALYLILPSLFAVALTRLASCKSPARGLTRKTRHARDKGPPAAHPPPHSPMQPSGGRDVFVSATMPALANGEACRLPCREDYLSRDRGVRQRGRLHVSAPTVRGTLQLPARTKPKSQSDGFQHQPLRHPSPTPSPPPDPSPPSILPHTSSAPRQPHSPSAAQTTQPWYTASHSP